MRAKGCDAKKITTGIFLNIKIYIVDIYISSTLSTFCIVYMREKKLRAKDERREEVE
jgi:hypothetical protein